MKASEVKVGMKVKIESTDFIVKLRNGVTGTVTKIVADPANGLQGFNILVTFDDQRKNGRGDVVRAEDLVAF